MTHAQLHCTDDSQQTVEKGQSRLMELADEA